MAEGLAAFVDIVGTMATQQREQFDGMFTTGKGMRDAIVETDAIPSKLAENEKTLAENLNNRDIAILDRQKLGLSAPYELQEAPLKAQTALMTSQSLNAQAKIDRENEIRYAPIKSELGSYLTDLGWGTQGGYSPEAFRAMPFSSMAQIVERAKRDGISSSAYMELAQGLDLKALETYEQIGPDNFARLAKMPKAEREAYLRSSRLETGAFKIINEAVGRLSGSRIEVNYTDTSTDIPTGFDTKTYTEIYKANNEGVEPSDAEIEAANAEYDKASGKRTTGEQPIATPTDATGMGGEQPIATPTDAPQSAPADLGTPTKSDVTNPAEPQKPRPQGSVATNAPVYEPDPNKTKVKVLAGVDGKLDVIMPSGIRVPFDPNKHTIDNGQLVLSDELTQVLNQYDSANPASVMSLVDSNQDALFGVFNSGGGNQVFNGAFQNEALGKNMFDMLRDRKDLEDQLLAKGLPSDYTAFKANYEKLRQDEIAGQSALRRNLFGFLPTNVPFETVLKDQTFQKYALALIDPVTKTQLVTKGDIENHMDGSKPLNGYVMERLEAEFDLAMSSETFYKTLIDYITPPPPPPTPKPTE